MIGVLCGVSLSSSMAHLPTLMLPLSLGADRGCGLLPCIVIAGGTWGLQLVLAEHPAHMSLLGAHAAHGLGRESQQLCHGWDHMQSASEWWQAAGSLLSGLHTANLKASWCGGQGLMPLVAGINAAVSSLLSSLQWSCPPSLYAP